LSATETPREAAPYFEAIEAEAGESQAAALSREFARQAGAGHRRIGGALASWVTSADVLTLNRCIGVGVERPATEVHVDEILAAFREAGTARAYIQVSPDARPAMLERWLESRGLKHHNNWTKVFRESGPAPAATSELRVEEVGAERGEEFARVATAAFGMPETLAPLLSSSAGRRGWHYYLASDGATPVASAALYTSGPLAWLGVGATLHEARGRGAQSALIARRIGDAHKLGCRWLVSETAQDDPAKPAPSYRNLVRLGFRLAYLRKNYLYVRPGAKPRPAAHAAG
jgi:hypothetical protein